MGILGKVLGVLSGSGTTTKQSGSTTSQSDLDSETLQKQITDATKKSTSSVVSTGTQSQQQASTGISESTTKTAQTATGGSTQVQSAFSSDALAILEGLFKGSAENILNSQNRSQALANLAAGQATGFDPAAFVADTLRAAESRFDRQNRESLNVLSSQIGGTPRDNSAAALIKGRLAEESTASIAGIRAQATAQAQDIAGANVSRAAGLESFNIENILQLGQLLKGGVSTGEVTSVSEQATTGAQAGTTAGTQTGEVQTSQQQQTDELETLLQLINSITSQDVSETKSGTSESTTKETSQGSLLDLFSGGGLSGLIGGVGSVLNLFKGG